MQGSLRLKMNVMGAANFYQRRSFLGLPLGWTRIPALPLGQFHWLEITNRGDGDFVVVQIRGSEVNDYSGYIDDYEDLSIMWSLIEARLQGKDLDEFSGHGNLTPTETADYWIKRGAISKEVFGRLHSEFSYRTGLFLDGVYIEDGPVSLRPTFVGKQ